MKNAPVISPWVRKFFVAYSRRYVARHFAALRLAAPIAFTDDRPTVVYLNHASWWDPLVALLLGEECFPGRPGFAPMDANELRRYGILRKIGIFGVEQGSVRGARDFLETSAAVLSIPRAMLWLTPQARFADSRERPVRFAGGLAALARRFPDALFVPLAIEYPMWNARLPEALARFGHATTGDFEMRLAETMDALGADAISRDPRRFQSLLVRKNARGESPAMIGNPTSA